MNTAVKLGGCVLLGLASTVATSWVFATAPVERLQGKRIRLSSCTAPIAPPEGGNLFGIQSRVGVGWLWVGTGRSFGRTPSPPRVLSPEQAKSVNSAPHRESSVRRWVRLNRPGTADMYREYYRRGQFASGWPAYALSFEVHQRDRQQQPTLQRGIPIVEDLTAYRTPFKGAALPLMPLVRGLLFDVGVHGCTWWAILFAPAAARRALRTRRGACPECGYCLRYGVEHRCPECGWRRLSPA